MYIREENKEELSRNSNPTDTTSNREDRNKQVYTITTNNLQECFVELELLNAQYEMLLVNDSTANKLMVAIKNKIVYLVTGIEKKFPLIYGNYREGVFPIYLYKTYLEWYSRVIENETGLACYQTGVFNEVRKEIARNKTTYRRSK